MTIEQQIADIKAHMPEVYKSIQAKAAVIGKQAFGLVRRGLRGEANCFFAFERGRVVGTPFNQTEVMAEIAKYMVQFGCTHIVVWAGEGGLASPPTAASVATLLSSSERQTPPIGTPTASSHAGNSTPAGAPVAGLGESPLSCPKAGG